MLNGNFTSLKYVNFRDLPHAPQPIQCFIGSSIEKFPSLVLTRSTVISQHPSGRDRLKEDPNVVTQ